MNSTNYNKPVILFFGLDKTGSTSLVNLFRQSFDHLRLKRSPGAQELSEEVKYIHKKFGGNFTQDSFKKLGRQSEFLFIDGFAVAPEWHAQNINLTKEDFSFTFLRHPIERLFSYAYYYKERRPPFLSRNTEDDIKSLLLKKQSVGDLFWLQQERGFTLESLSNLNFVGITERMNESLERISQMLNINLGEIQRHNTTQKGQDERQLLKAKYFDDLCDLYVEDLEIYNFFHQQIE